MRIQSFRARIDDDKDAVVDHLGDGLSVIGGSHFVADQIANRLYGNRTRHGTEAELSVTQDGAPIHLAEATPAVLTQDCIESADLPVLRDTLFLDGESDDEWQRRKVPSEVCLCGRRNCPANAADVPHSAARENAECVARLEHARRKLIAELERTREAGLRCQRNWELHDQQLSTDIANAYSRRDQLRAEIQRLEAEVETITRQAEGWETERAAIAWQKDKWNFTAGIAKLETQLAECDGNLLALGLDGPPPATDRCNYLQRASAYLSELTGGYLRQVIDNRNEQVGTKDHQGRLFNWPNLSKSGRNLVKLSLSMAAVEGWERHGLRLPLLVEEPLAHLKNNEVQYVVTALKRFAANKRQVLVFTTDDLAQRYFAAERVALKEIETTPPANDLVPEREVHWDHLSADDDNTELEDESDLASQEPELTPKQRLVAALRAVSIDSTLEFLEFDPEDLAVHLRSHGYSATELTVWQDRIALLHFLPELADDDASVLIACDCGTLAKLGDADAELLHARILQFLRSEEGRKYRRLRTRYELPRIRGWSKLVRRRRGDWSRGTYGKRLARRGESIHHLPRHERRRGDYEPKSIHSADRETVTRLQDGEAESDVIKLHRHDNADTFYLSQSSPIVDAPSIGPKMAERFEAIGIRTVGMFLAADPKSVASRLKHRRTKASHIREWQRQSRLMCRVPGLRGHDAQILVALDYDTPEQIAVMSPTKLFAEVEPFCRTRAAKRIIRNMDPPDLAEVTDWIDWCQQARLLSAA